MTETEKALLDSIGQRREAEAEVPGIFDTPPGMVNAGSMTGFPVYCKACHRRTIVVFTISAHQWGCMVHAACGHIFPAELSR